MLLVHKIFETKSISNQFQFTCKNTSFESFFANNTPPVNEIIRDWIKAVTVMSQHSAGAKV